jgi:very-short-patch-repair endonuclease
MPVKNIIPGQRVTKEKLQRAKELRREMTPAEKILWEELRANKLGVHFRRQQVIAGFIVDFYCHKAGLVIEVDGDIHDLQQEEDARREKALHEMGLMIIRFRNDKILMDLLTAVEKIRGLVQVNNLIQQAPGLKQKDITSAIAIARGKDEGHTS